MSEKLIEPNYADPLQFPRRAAARMRKELRTKYRSYELENLVAVLDSNPTLAAFFLENQ